MIGVPVRDESDVFVARRRARELATRLGFPERRAAALATAVSEVAWNLIHHGGGGEVVLEAVEGGGRRGVVVTARDAGPGISDLGALRDGHSTRGGLGLGVTSARRLSDAFHIRSAAGEGTVVTLKKWAHDPDD